MPKRKKNTVAPDEKPESEQRMVVELQAKFSANCLLNYLLRRQGLIDRIPFSDVAPRQRKRSRKSTSAAASNSNDASSLNFVNSAILPKLSSESRQYNRYRCMRGTLHLIPEQFDSAIATLFNKSFLQRNMDAEKFKHSKNDLEAVRTRILEILREHGPCTTKQIKNYFDKCPLRHLTAHLKSVEARNNKIPCSIRHFMELMLKDGEVEFGIGVGSWRSKNLQWSIRKRQPSVLLSHDEACAMLVRSYLHWYGPASLKDMIWWWGNAADPRTGLKIIEKEVANVVVEGLQEYELLMLKEDLPAFIASPDSKIEMVRFLPYEDALLKAYKETRFRFFGFSATDPLIDHVIRRGEAMESIWHNGRVIGRWEWPSKPGNPVTMSLPEPVPKSLESQLLQELEHYSDFLEYNSIIINGNVVFGKTQ